MAFSDKSDRAERLLFVLDLLLTVLVFLVAYYFRTFVLGRPFVDLLAQLALVLLFLPPLGVLLWQSGIYTRMRYRPPGRYAWLVARSIFISLVVVSTVLFLLRAEFISRSLLLIFGATLFLVLVANRTALTWWYFRGSVESADNYTKLLIMGTGERAKRLTDRLKDSTEWGIEVIGYLDCSMEPNAVRVERDRIRGHVDQISSILQQTVVDELVIAVPRSMIPDAQVIADACAAEGVTLNFMADVFDLPVSRMRLTDLMGLPLLSFEPVAQDENRLIVKRIFDLAATMAALPFLLPVLLAVAIAIKLDSRGPIFFLQERVGLHKRRFKMYKFRSMRPDAEERMSEVEHLNEAEGPIFKIARDPRLTRIGGFLRRTSLDELPQLFNVLRGQMSLVGPRPMSVRDVRRFDQAVQRKRFSVRPGLTCLWQISGRSNLPFSKWLELDLRYIETWSLWLDVKILLLTIPRVIRGSGAT